MQFSTPLVSAGLMGVLLVAVVIAVLAGRDWRHEEAGGRRSASSGERASRLVRRAARSQLVWTLGFLALAVGFGGAVVLFLDGGPASATAGAAGVAVAVGVLLAFLGVGTYRTVRFRGRSSAGAAAVTAWTLGALFLLAVSVNLLLS